MFKHKTEGYTVKLTAQDENSVCHFERDGVAQSCPSHQFFTAFEEVAEDQAEPDTKEKKTKE